MADLVSSRINVPLRGVVTAPGDKSCSHRTLMLGSVARGTSVIRGLLHSQDVYSTAMALRQLGAHFDTDGNGDLRVTAPDMGFSPPHRDVDVGNSGTSARLLMGLLCGRGVSFGMNGDASLRRRPMRRVVDPLRQMGARIDLHDENLPAQIDAVRRLRGLAYHMPVASAQVKSALLLATLCADGVTTISEPAPTRDHTERLLKFMGAVVDHECSDSGAKTLRFAGGQDLRAALLDVPGDPSSAAFLLGAAAMIPGSDVTVRNVMINPYRSGFMDTLVDMGAQISFDNQRPCCGENVADVRLVYAPLRAVDVPPERIPAMIDEIPILSVVAATIPGMTRMPALAELRVKESDRLTALALGLNACGVDARVAGDMLTVNGTPDRIGGGARIFANLDHRIAMGFLILGLLAQNPVRVSGTETIDSSFPSFAAMMEVLGARFDSVRDAGTVRVKTGGSRLAAQFVDLFGGR
jgi:3-phosphoshikimate 1-carboxyvinyltransferase